MRAGSSPPSGAAPRWPARDRASTCPGPPASPTPARRPGNAGIEPLDHRLVHLVAARADRRADRADKVSGALRPPRRARATAARAAALPVPRHPACAAASRPARGIVEHEGHAIGGEDRERQSRAVRHDRIRPARPIRPARRARTSAPWTCSQERRRPRAEPELRQQRSASASNGGPGSRGEVTPGKVSRGEQMREPGLGEAGRRQIERLSALLVEGEIGHARHCLTRRARHRRCATAATASADVITGMTSNSITSAQRAVHCGRSAGSSHSMIW